MWMRVILKKRLRLRLRRRRRLRNKEVRIRNKEVRSLPQRGETQRNVHAISNQVIFKIGGLKMLSPYLFKNYKYLLGKSLSVRSFHSFLSYLSYFSFLSYLSYLSYFSYF
jgi:hypothetical protein